jgi:hypothetical protein
VGYTVHLFAHNSDLFTERIGKDREGLIRETRARLIKERKLDTSDIKHGLELIDRIFQDNLPAICDEDYFWALCWVADTVLERIPLEDFIHIKGFSFIEKVGLWPMLAQWTPPFVVPKSLSIPPAVGFAPHVDIARAVIPALVAMDNAVPVPRYSITGRPIPERFWNDANGPYVKQARRQFREVLESLVEDGMDLLAIATP